MKNYFLCFLLLVGSAFNFSFGAISNTSLSSNRGIAMLLESEHRTPYWLLSQYYETQVNGTFCGVASAVMVLNALNIPKPALPFSKKFTLFTQDNFYNEQIQAIAPKEDVLKKGLTLEQLANAIKTYNVQVDPYFASTMTLEEFRDLIKQFFAEPDHFLIANFYRPTVEQTGAGHFSPIVAYNQANDALLILDVARFKHTGTWVDLKLFFQSMQTIDKESNASRGFILIQPPH